MSIPIKKISSLFFILLGFSPLLFVLLFALKQQTIRNHMKERMEEQVLRTIAIADNQVNWMEEGKEIWVDGKMFDIESYEHKNGMTIFHGLYDDEETSLRNHFNEAWKKNSSNHNQLLYGLLFQFLSGIYYDHPADISILPLNQQNLFAFASLNIPTQFKTIHTPPPQGYCLY